MRAMMGARPGGPPLFVPVLLVSLMGPILAQDPFTRDFTAGTMRVDYFHTGGPGGEVVALDRVVNDGPWAGSRTRLLDDTNLGKADCIMFTRDEVGFCRVCRRAIERIIDLYARN